MINCNPETVSTDYDTSDRLYFEPLDAEEVLSVCEREQPDGVATQFGGQTPLRLARARGRRATGSSARPSMPSTSQRTANGSARCRPARHPLSAVGDPGARTRQRRSPSGSASRFWYGPSYVLGGRAMRVCYSAATSGRSRAPSSSTGSSKAR